MKLRTVSLALGLVWVASGAEAGWFSGLLGQHRLPAPISLPRSGVVEYHKPGYRGGRHPEKYRRPEWGTQKKVVFQLWRAPQSHYLYK